MNASNLSACGLIRLNSVLAAHHSLASADRGDGRTRWYTQAIELGLLITAWRCGYVVALMLQLFTYSGEQRR